MPQLNKSILKHVPKPKMGILNGVERALCMEIVMHGPAIFDERGISEEDRMTFMSRPEVRLELEKLASEVLESDRHQSRVRFGAQRQLSRLVSSAIRVLSDAIRGVDYVRGPNGEILLDAKGRPMVQELAPDDVQLDAAKQILDRVGITSKTADNAPLQEINVNVLLQQAQITPQEIVYPEGASEVEKALSRERMRTAVLKLSSEVKKAHDKIDAVTEPFVSKPKPKPKLKSKK